MEQDPLAIISARELCSALHWTSKQDLREAIDDCRPEKIDELWKSLQKADSGLQQFYAYQLVDIIKQYQSNKLHNRV